MYAGVECDASSALGSGWFVIKFLLLVLVLVSVCILNLILRHQKRTCRRGKRYSGCPRKRGGGLGSSTIFKKFNEPYAPS